MPRIGDLVAYFWVPLEQHLIPPPGPYTYDLDPTSWPAGLAKPSDASLPSPVGDVSIALVDTESIWSEEGMTAAARVAAQSMAKLFGTRPSVRSRFWSWITRATRFDPPRVQQTVIEAAVTLPSTWTPDPTKPDEVLTSALDSALLSIKLLLLQVYSDHKETPRSIPTAENLPPLVPFVVIRRTKSGLERVINPGVFRNELGETRHELIAHSGSVPDLPEHWTPFLPFWSIRNDAAVCLQLRGQYRAALILIAAAAENMLDTFTQFLLWEEGTSPEAASVEYRGRTGIVARTRRLLPPRIGGNWSGAGTSPVADWHSRVVEPRNESSHLGMDVSRDEARQAWNALDGLRLHIGGRVFANQAKYPFTSLATHVGLNVGPIASKDGTPKTALRIVESMPKDQAKQIFDFEVWRERMKQFV